MNEASHPSLPRALYRAAQVRELDRLAIEEYGIAGRALMERAGESAWRRLQDLWPEAKRLVVVCGPGNNGGDGFVLARCAHEAGYAVTVLLLCARERLRGDARSACEDMERAGLTPRVCGPSGLRPDLELGSELAPELGPELAGAEVVVDALLGTGLDRPVEGVWREAIEAVNAAPAPVLALDVPSGLDADRGTVWGVAVEAQATVTFIGLKQGLFTAAGPDHCGRLFYEDLQVPPQLFDRVPPAAERLDWEAVRAWLPPRPRAAHKGHFGHVLVVGGAPGLSGAAHLAAAAAARCGAGLVTVATHPCHAAVLNVGRPELMVHGVADGRKLRALLSRATVVAVGPGLGRSAWGRALLDTLLDALEEGSGVPLVVDADALWALAGRSVRREDWILTPHPGEAARLLGLESARAVQQDRFAALEALQRRFGGVCVLKGNGTLIGEKGAGEGGHPVGLCHGGNPGMASGGMGDVLTGVIAAAVAQGLPLERAARFGVCLHAAAGDRAARAGARGLLAGDLLEQLQALLR